MSRRIKLLVFVSCLLACLQNAGAASLPVILSGAKHGPAQIEGAESPCYFLRTRLEAREATVVTFKQDTCVLVTGSGAQVTECWIQITGGSAGLSEEKTAPLDMKTLTEATAGSTATPLSHNTSRIDGPDGSIVYTIPKGGYVELCFFWPVTKDCQPKRVVLKGIAELAL